MSTETVLVTGNTYPVREKLKALGGVWDANARGWRMPKEVAEQAQALLQTTPQAFGGSKAKPRYIYRPGMRPGQKCGYPGCSGGLYHCDECT